jgi:ankyrin repeat protein
MPRLARLAIFGLVAVTAAACTGSAAAILQESVERGSVSEAQAALRRGANPNAFAKDGLPLIASAVKRGNFDVATELVAAGGNPNVSIDGADAFFVVLTMGNKCSAALVKAMIKAGKSPSAVDAVNDSALDEALTFGSEACVTQLIASGADINGRNDLGETALHAAVLGSNVGRVNEFLEAGLDVDAKVKGEITPLMLAAGRHGDGADDIVEALLARGANPCARDSKGRDASAVALSSGLTSRAVQLKHSCESWNKKNKS